MLSLGVSAMHLGSQSFLIYLKYQAMVDAYYYQEVLKKSPVIAVEGVVDEAKVEASEAPTEKVTATEKPT